MNSSARVLSLTMLIALMLAAMASLLLGAVNIDFLSAFGSQQGINPDAVILWEIRLPRTLLAMVAGATFGLCGAIMQGYLRNPLASPGLLGNASGAALFSVLLLYFAGHYVGLLPLAGILGSFCALWVVLAMVGNNPSTTVLILAGVAVNTLCAAAIALLLNLADSPWALRDLYLWTQGSLSSASMQDLYVAAVPIVIAVVLFIRCVPQLDALSLGEDSAASMGVELPTLRWQIILALSFAIGAVIPATGLIGFVGLVVPHILRPLVGHQPSQLVLPSALLGALLLLLADLLVRVVDTASELRIGVITAMIGGPFFVLLIVRHRREWF